jgi:hypothetical protein
MKSHHFLAQALAAAGLIFSAGVHAVTMVGLTTDNRLTTFDSATPDNQTPYLAISGVSGGARIVGIDTRPSDGKIYGLSTDNKVYTIDALTGVATLKVNLGSSFVDSGKAYGVDFNIAADLANGTSLRVVSSTGQNYAVNVTTGAVVTATSLPGSPSIGAVAYNNYPMNGSGVPSGLYYIDFASDSLIFEPTAFNAPNPVLKGSLGFDTIGAFGFDAISHTTAFAGLTSAITGQGGFYSIDLLNGTASLVGLFPTSSPLLAGLTTFGIAPVPEAETYAMMLAGLGLVGYAVRRRRAA